MAFDMREQADRDDGIEPPVRERQRPEIGDDEADPAGVSVLELPNVLPTRGRASPGPPPDDPP